jgi:hypothetical protein
MAVKGPQPKREEPSMEVPMKEGEAQPRVGEY